MARPKAWCYVFMNSNLLNILACLLLSVLTIGCSSTPPLETSTDALMRGNLVGYWTPDPSKETDVTGYVIYKPDGNRVARVYKSLKCDVLIAEIQGSWQIENAHLILVTTKSTNQEWRKTGHIGVDRIVELSDSHLVLQNSDGVLRYRVRGKTCADQT